MKEKLITQVNLKSKIGQSILIALIVSLAISVLYLTNSLERIEQKVFDFKAGYGSRPEKVDSNIVIVSVDQTSLDYFEANGQSWPWPREFYALVVDYLTSAGARAILFDIDFSSSEIERLESEAVHSEQRFAETINKAGNVILITILSQSADINQRENELLEKHLIHVYDGISYPNYNTSLSPLIPFQESCFGIGAANTDPDVDGIIRRVPMLFSYKEKFVTQPAVSIIKYINQFDDDELKEFVKKIPLVDGERYLINWYGPGGDNITFRYNSIQPLIISGYKINSGQKPGIPLNKFKDKIVIIGGSAFGLLDYKPVPVGYGNVYPGMEIHATILNNLLHNDFIRTSPVWIVLILILFFSFITPILFFRIRKVLWKISIIILLLILFPVINFYLYEAARICLDLIAPGLSILISFLAVTFISYMTEGKQKREIKKIFGRYISPEVVEDLISDPSKIELGGKEVEATVFFSDIKDFTTLSESLAPKELVNCLNEYFSHVTEFILSEKAMLDKYIGDSVMAVFGVPVYREDHAAAACSTALKIQSSLHNIYSESKLSGKMNLITRIGIHTGNMIVGNIGTEARKDFTVIGDTVNIASRLEGLNKLFGTKIILSESTYSLIQNAFEVRELDYVAVKGKNKPIRIYELICEAGKLSDGQKNKLNKFRDGLEMYRNKEWDKAIELFNISLKIDGHDSPSRVYIERCKDLKKIGVDTHWDGVYHSLVK